MEPMGVETSSFTLTSFQSYPRQYAFTYSDEVDAFVVCCVSSCWCILRVSDSSSIIINHQEKH